MRLRKLVPSLLLLALTLPLQSQEKTVPSAGEPAVYVVVFRTPAHVRLSKPEVFHGFATDLWGFLKDKGIPLKVDPERGTIETESPMSVGSMLNIARQARPSSMLFVTVDRPATSGSKSP